MLCILRKLGRYGQFPSNEVRYFIYYILRFSMHLVLQRNFHISSTSYYLDFSSLMTSQASLIFTSLSVLFQKKKRHKVKLMGRNAKCGTCPPPAICNNQWGLWECYLCTTYSYAPGPKCQGMLPYSS